MSRTHGDRVYVIIDGHPDHRLERTLVDAPDGVLPPEVLVVEQPEEPYARWYVPGEEEPEEPAWDVLRFELAARFTHPDDLRTFRAAALYRYAGKAPR